MGQQQVTQLILALIAVMAALLVFIMYSWGSHPEPCPYLPIIAEVVSFYGYYFTIFYLSKGYCCTPLGAPAQGQKSDMASGQVFFFFFFARLCSPFFLVFGFEWKFC